MKNSNADLASLPGRLGGRGLIPEPLGLTPEPVQRRAMTLARLPLTAAPVEFLLGRVGTLQGAGGRAPGLPQRTPPFTERMEDVERVVEVGQAGGATAGALELHPFAQARSRRPGPPPRAPGIGRIPRPRSTPSRASTIRPVSQQRLSGSTTIRTGLRPKKSRRRCPA